MSPSNTHSDGVEPYEVLASFFEAHQDTSASIEVLPAGSFPASSVGTLRDGSSLAITPSALARAFVAAHRVFFDPNTSREDGLGSTPRYRDPPNSHASRASPVSHAPPPPSSAPRSEDALDATTSTILLFAPEHTTAANRRKRQLLRASRTLSTLDFQALLRRELCLLNTLCTSPLHKHPKSPTLWAHREWLVCGRWVGEAAAAEAVAEEAESEGVEPEGVELQEAEAPPEPELTSKPTLEVRPEPEPELEAGARPELDAGARPELDAGARAEAEAGSSSLPPPASPPPAPAALWRSELRAVLAAANQHFANYYAFDYARRLRCAIRRAYGCDALRHGEGWSEVTGFCLLNPRDVSGWAFLRDLLLEGEIHGEADGLREEVVTSVRLWVGHVGWRGEAVDVFLEAMDRYGRSETRASSA